MLFYLFVILFTSAFAQAAPTESTTTDLKEIIEEMTTLRPSTVNETVYSDTKASQALGSSLESAGAEIISTTFNSVEDDGVSAVTQEFTTVTPPITDGVISTLTPETTTESSIDSTTETDISSITTPTSNDEISTLTSETTTESFLVSTTPNDLTSDGVTTTLTPEIITDPPTTESQINNITTPTTNDEISTLMPEITTESLFTSTTSSESTTTTTEDGITTTLTPETTTELFLTSTTPIESTTDSTTTSLIPEIITDAPTTETEISSSTTPTTNDEISTLVPETTTESFLVSTTPIESTTDGVTTTLTVETTTAASTSASEAIDTALNPSTVGVISTSTVGTPTTEETVVQSNENSATAHIFHTSQFVLKHETPEYCNWYQVTCNNYLNNQSFCRYSLVGNCDNFKAYQIWPIKQLVREFTYVPYTFNYQYVHKEQRFYGCYLYRVKCEHHHFINVKTEQCYHEYVGQCSNYQMIHAINSSFY